MHTPKKNQMYSYNVKKGVKLVYNFCSSVYSLTIINLYVHLLPVTDGGQNNQKNQHQILLLKGKMSRKKIMHGKMMKILLLNRKTRKKKMKQGKMMMMLSLTVF